MDDLLTSGGDQNVCVLEHDVLPSVGLSPGEAHDGAVLLLVLLESLRVNPVLVVDAAIVLGHSDTLATSTCQITTRVKTHVTKSLDDVGFASPARCLANHRHVQSLVDEVLKTMEDSTPGGAGTAVNTPLVNRLPCNKNIFKNIKKYKNKNPYDKVLGAAQLTKRI